MPQSGRKCKFRGRNASVPRGLVLRVQGESRVKNLGPLIGLAAVYVLFCLWAGEPFYSNFNRVTVLTQSVIVTAGALGMTLIIIAGWPPWAAACTGILVGGACGAAVIRNGLSIKGVPNWVQDVPAGSIIVAAVTIERLRYRSRSEA